MAKKAKQLDSTIYAAEFITQAPVADLVPHPDNPRTVRLDEEFLESVRAVGVIEPLTTRELDGQLQVLSGHRRLAAAKEVGLPTVPVRNLGEVGDRQAFDIVAMANLHEELTPLEEGKRAAMWLDRYDQDARAVASKLGKTPHFVVQHAQIYRNLAGDWVTAAQTAKQERYGASMRDMLERWTASHWAAIARLPHAMQIAQLKKFQSGSYYSYDRWTVQEMEDRIGLEMLDLAKAPFDVATCAKCLNRTGAQPAFLWSEDEDGAAGDTDKCLDKKCWLEKCARAEREKFKAQVVAKDVPDAAPLCLLKEPKDWYKQQDYRKQVSALKKIHGKKLLTAETVEIVKKATQGAVPAIVVAGQGKNAVKWVKPLPAKKKPAIHSNADWERQRKEQQEEDRRWKIVEDAIVTQIRAMAPPDLAVVAVAARCLLSEIWGGEFVKLMRETAQRSGTVRDTLWLALVETSSTASTSTARNGSPSATWWASTSTARRCTTRS